MHNFKGIDRTFTSQGSDELVNLRLKNNTLDVVRDKTFIFNQECDKALAITIDNEEYIITQNARVISIFKDNTHVQSFTLEDDVLDITTIADNIVIATDRMIVYIEKKNEGFYINQSLAFHTPLLSFQAEVGKTETFRETIDYPNFYENYSTPDALLNLFRTIYESNTSDTLHLYESYIAIRAAYKTKSGIVINLSSPILLELCSRQGYAYIDTQPETAQPIIELRDIRKFKASITIAAVNASLADIFESVIIYSTRPIPAYSFNELIISDDTTPDRVNYNILNNTIYKDIDDELYYELKEIKITELSSKYDISIDPNTYKDITSNNDAETINELAHITGQLYSYNNRIHVYNPSKTYYSSNMQSVYFDTSSEQLSACYANTQNSDFFVGRISSTAQGYLNSYLTIPYEADKIKFTQDVESSINLSSSKRHNYSFAYVNTIRTLDLDDTTLTDENPYHTIQAVSTTLDHIINIDTIIETKPLTSNSINVSTSTNYNIFPVQYSYLFHAKINSISINTTQFSESQVGLFPLYVFTQKGVFAMQQGTGDIMYSNIIPISIDVGIESTTTVAGIIYIAKNGYLRLLTGDKVTELSLSLLELDKNIRDDIAIKNCTQHPLLSETFKYISQVPFDIYAKKAKLFYDNESVDLIISNTDYNYSYVFNLNSQSFHKIDKVYKFSQDKIILDNNNNIYSTDEVETNKDILLLTTPIYLEKFTMIKQAEIIGNFIPTTNYLSTYILCSNDNVNYEVVCAKQLDMAIFQRIILNKVRKSYKFIRVLIAGNTKESVFQGINLNIEQKYTSKIR